MKHLIIYILFVSACLGASPQTCTAVKSGNASDPTVWGSCTASGGTSISYMGSTQTLSAGVPGASGSKDRVVVPAPYVVTADVNLELGDPASETVTALTIQGSSSGSFGQVTQTSGHVISLHGYDSVAQAHSITQWGILATVPGSALWLSTSNSATAAPSGRWYIGCGALATIGCSASAGAWVQANTGTPGTFSAWTGGTGLYAKFNNQTLPTVSIGDLVEFLIPPLPAATGTGQLGPPYTPTPCYTVADPVLGFNVDMYCGMPPSAPAPPIMPLTSDSTTCGGAASCSVPHGQPLCVVQVSPLKLGYAIWASDGWECSSPPAMAITDAGTGPFWLIKPAFVSTPPSYVTWNTSQSNSISALVENYDAIRTHLEVPGYISNAAGTGPEKKGDSSFVPSGITIKSQLGNGATATSLTRKDRCQTLTTIGDYTLDPISGVMCLWGGSDKVTLATASTGLAVTGAQVTLGNSSSGAGTELLIQNSDIRNLFTTSGGSAVWSLNSYNSSTANNRLAVTGSNLFNTSAIFQTNSLTGTANSPIPFEGNEINNSMPNAASIINTGTSSSYVSISANYMTMAAVPVVGTNVTSGVPDQPHWSFIGNVGTPSSLITANAHAVTFSDALLSRNRFESPTYAGGGVSIVAGISGHPAITEWSTYYGYRISLKFDSFNEIRYVNFPFSGVHHTIIANDYGNGGPVYFRSVLMHHLLQPGWQGLLGGGDFLDFGYQGNFWTDGIQTYNNTVIGAQVGCMSQEDVGDSGINMVTGGVMANTICQTAYSGAYMFTRGLMANGILGNPQLITGLNNSMYGTFAGYYTQTATAPPNQNTLLLNRYINPLWKSGTTNYNTDATRGCLGVSIQNPTYATLGSTGSLTCTYTSASNSTFTWNDGTGAGPAVQANWAGAGTTYTLTGLVSGSFYGQLAVSGTPWTCGNSGQTDFAGNQFYLLGCPAGNYVRMLTGAAAGKVYGITCGPITTEKCDNGHLGVVPDPTADGATSGDTFAILMVDLKLPNSGATQSIEVGLDPRLLPTSTLTDSGISLVASGICASGCATTGDTAIPQTYTWDVTNSPLSGGINSPMQGPDPTVQAFAANGPFVPTATAWKTQGTSGGAIGAIPAITAALSGPTGAPVSYGFTYSLTAGNFSGGTPLTCTDSGNGTFLMGGVYSHGSGTATPTSGATSYAISYTPANSGSHTVSCTTTLGAWIDPGATTFSGGVNPSFPPIF